MPKVLLHGRPCNDASVSMAADDVVDFFAGVSVTVIRGPSMRFKPIIVRSKADEKESDVLYCQSVDLNRMVIELARYSRLVSSLRGN